jgi:hypothetical protein
MNVVRLRAGGVYAGDVGSSFMEILNMTWSKRARKRNMIQMAAMTGQALLPVDV